MKEGSVYVHIWIKRIVLLFFILYLIAVLCFQVLQINDVFHKKRNIIYITNTFVIIILNSTLKCQKIMIGLEP